MSSKKYLSVFLLPLLLFTAALPAQDRAYAKQVVDTLASPSMHGRGYVNNGDKIAAKYIADQFKSYSLISFNIAGTYYQNFSFPINTFPGKLSLKVWFGDGLNNLLTPGEEFLIQCQSPSVKGHFAVVLLDSSVVYNDVKLEAFKKMNLKKSFVMVDTAGVRNRKQKDFITNFIKYPLNVRGIIIPEKQNPMTESCFKLQPWDMSMVQSTIPVIEIAYKYKTISAIDISVQAKFIKNYTSQNVIGYIKGSERPDSFIVYTAHYDHLGQMGKNIYFPGANDNASGVAMLMSLARYYSMPEHKPRFSIVFMAFSAEEVGLIGSRWYNLHPLFPLKQIKFLINMDILGTGDEGITVVNATEFPYQFEALKALNVKSHYLTLVKPRGKAAISDHFFFTEAKVPCFYIYTLGGLKAYHDTCDRRETLPLTEFEDLFSLLRDFTDQMCST